MKQWDPVWVIGIRPEPAWVSSLGTTNVPAAPEDSKSPESDSLGLQECRSTVAQ